MNIKVKAKLILFLTLFLSCAKKTQREMLNTNIFQGDKYKTFSVSVTHDDFLSAKEKIYKEVLIFSIKKLIGEKNAQKQRLIKSLLNNRDKSEKYFVKTNDKIIQRKRYKSGIQLIMSTTLKIFEVTDDLKRIGFKKIKINDLLMANEILNIDSKIKTQEINRKGNYSYFKNNSIGFFHRRRGKTLPEEKIKKIYNYINRSLNRININVPDYSSYRLVISKNSNIKYVMKVLSLDYLIDFTENTSMKNIFSNQQKVNSIIKLVLYNKKLKILNSVNILIDQLLNKNEGVSILLAKEIFQKGILSLLQKSSLQFEEPKKYHIIFVNFPSARSIYIFLNKIDKDQKLKLQKIEDNKFKTSILFKGSRQDFQNKVLQVLEKNNLENNIYLTDSGKKMIEFTFKSVKMN
jgi:hypothetical protein